MSDQLALPPYGVPSLRPGTARLLAGLRVALSVADPTRVPAPSPGERGAGEGPVRDAGEGGARAGSGGRETGRQTPDGLDRVAALVELAQRGDGEAFGQIYALYVDTVYRYVYVRVGSRQTAEDITSETFVRALRRIGSFTWQGRDIAAWFVTIARNLITDNAKSARFRLEVTTAEMLDGDERMDAPETEVLQRIRDARLLDAVRALGPEQAECVVLRFLQGLSLAETAEVMGKSEGAVKQLQLRAVRALRREIGDEEL